MSDIMLTSAEQVKAFHVLAVTHALALEINTGMKLSNRGSALDAARIQGIIPMGKRTSRKAALKAAIEVMKTIDPAYEPKPMVAKALNS